jgi:hypothetical protein
MIGVEGEMLGNAVDGGEQDGGFRLGPWRTRRAEMGFQGGADLGGPRVEIGAQLAQHRLLHAHPVGQFPEREIAAQDGESPPDQKGQRRFFSRGRGLGLASRGCDAVRGGEGFAHVLHGTGEKRAKQIAFAFEMAVQKPQGHARLFGDAPYRRARVPVFGEDAQRGVQEFRARGIAQGLVLGRGPRGQKRSFFMSERSFNIIA